MPHCGIMVISSETKPHTRGKMSRSSAQIQSFEQEARNKYNSALLRLRDEKPANWFQHSLDKNILPPLSQIGFDNQLSQTLFQIALPSWQKMGPSIDDCLWIHPRLTKDIEEIRKTVLIKAEKKRKTQTTLANMNSREIYNHTRRSMAPENLTSLLDDISTSWIILPRAHSLLRENDGCCLISYLKYLKREKSPDFKRLIARIITEFLANYSLKYARAKQPQRAVTEVIFYGYAAMFWKNLRHPPDGCEELAIYKNFLGLAKAFQKRTHSITSDMAKTVKEMMVMEKTLFPGRHSHSTTIDKQMDSGKFLITLRHGQRGIETTCGSFGVVENTLKHSSRNRFLIISGPKALTRLIREIEKKYASETQKTREAILLFTSRLKNAYALHNSHPTQPQKKSLEWFAFAGPRLVTIVNNFKQSHQQEKTPASK